MSELENIGRYKIKKRLGHGGMATVYHAYDPQFGRDVAIKVLPPESLDNPMMQARFEREARTIASLEHPAIVPVYDFGQENGQPYLVMRLMTGGTLVARLQQGPLATSEVARILERIGSALDEAHKRGVIHRDLKPGNILFDQYGDAYLSDFGIVRLTTSQTDLTGAGSLGTPGYMSPEQIQGEGVDNRTDIYALGVIAFEMLTGKPPFAADSPAMVLVKQMTEPLPRIGAIKPDLSSQYDDVFERTLSREPTERPATAGELIELLVAAAHSSRQAAELLAAAARSAVRQEPAVPRPMAAAGAPATTEPPESDAPEEITTPISPAGQLASKRRRPLTLWLLGAGVVLVVVVSGLLLLNLLNRRDNQVADQATATERPEMTAFVSEPEAGTPVLALVPSQTPLPIPGSTQLAPSPTEGMLAGASGAAANGLCGTPVTSDLTLTADLYCPDGDGLVIGADGITVDLGGFTVSGEDVIGTVGILVHGFQDVIIINGTVRGFHIGVIIETNPSTLRTASATVSNIHATENLNIGFLTTSEPGILPSTSTLTNNIASYNGDAGIYFNKGTFTASRNIARDNGAHGIVAHGSAGTLDRDQAFNNAFDGVTVVDFDDAGAIHHGILTAESVLSHHNGGPGFAIGGSPGSDGAEATLVKNRALYNDGPGYACALAHATSGSGNLAVGNAGGATDGACSFPTTP